LTSAGAASRQSAVITARVSERTQLMLPLFNRGRALAALTPPERRDEVFRLLPQRNPIEHAVMLMEAQVAAKGAAKASVPKTG